MEETKTETIANETLPVKKNWLKEIGTTIPIISLFVAFLGVIRTYLFYNHFDIQIANYIGLSELTSLIIYDIIRLSPYIVEIFIVSEIGMAFKSYLKKKNDTDKKVNKTKANITNVISVLVILIFFGYSIFKSQSVFNSMMGMPMLFSLIVFIYLSIKIENIPPFLPLAFVTSFFFFLKTIEFEVYGIEHKKYLGTVISAKDKTYISSDSTYYIGKTASFVFIYNKYDSSNTIIPTAEIKLMKIKINGKWF